MRADQSDRASGLPCFAAAALFTSCTIHFARCLARRAAILAGPSAFLAAAEASAAAGGGTCCFCRQPADPGVPGNLAGLLAAPREPGKPPLLYHEACAGYSSGIAYGRRPTKHQPRQPYGHGEIPAHLVAAEWTRGARLHCAVCGQLGATLNCTCVGHCRLCWHLPCARQAAQAGGEVCFSAAVMEAACKQHRDRYSPCCYAARQHQSCPCAAAAALAALHADGFPGLPLG